MTKQSPRIVMVEDEADVARYLAAALEDEGFTVRTADNAEEGLELVRAFRPDLVCLDIVMPGPTGLSLCREIRSDPEFMGIPIVVVSGVNPADAETRLGLGSELPGPDAFIEKPVDLGELVAVVRRLTTVRGG